MRDDKIISNESAAILNRLLSQSIDVNTTMNVYAHATRADKRDFVKLLDKVVGMS